MSRLLDEPSEYVPLTIDAKPHNGAPGYQDERGVGGQMLLIDLCLNFRRVIAPVGRRFGKTTGFGFILLEMIPRKSGFFYGGLIEPDHAKAAEAFERFLEGFGGDPKENPESLVKAYHRSEKQDRWIELRPMETEIDGELLDENTGSRIYFWSGKHPHYNAIRGFMHHFDFVCLDEAKDLRREVLAKVVLPMLADSGGHLLVIGTPDVESIGNLWFEKTFRRGRSGLERWGNWASMNFPTKANPTLKPQYVQELYDECLTEDDRIQELEARFLDNVSGVFGHLERIFTLEPMAGLPDWLNQTAMRVGMAHWDARVHENPIPGLSYVIGADWARKRDKTVFTVHRTDNGRQAALIWFEGEDFEEQMAFLAALRGVYNDASIHSDANGVGDAMTNALMKRWNEAVVAHVWGGPTKKQAYVRRVLLLFKIGAIKMIAHDDSREEFRIYVGEKNDNGTIKYGHPDGEHDDFVDAVLLVGEALEMPFHPESQDETESREEFPVGTWGHLHKQIEEETLETWWLDSQVW